MQVETFIYYLWTNKNSATREERKKKKTFTQKVRRTSKQQGRSLWQGYKTPGRKCDARWSEICSDRNVNHSWRGEKGSAALTVRARAESIELWRARRQVRGEQQKAADLPWKKKKEKWIWRRGKVTRHGEAKTQVGGYEMSVLSFGHWWHHHLWMLWKSR